MVSGVAGRLLAALRPPSKPEGFPSVSAGYELLLARSREMTAELSQVTCTKAPPPSKVLMLRNREQRIRTRRSPNTALGVQGENSPARLPQPWEEEAASRQVMQV